MSTSPSWFDQEKFSRLVKKVAPKAVTEPLPSVHANPHTQSLTPSQGENPSAENPNPASTSRISLVSKPPSLLSEHRALPALPRRTSPLPSLKPVFAYDTPPKPVAPAESIPDAEHGEADEHITTSEVGSIEEEESALAETWHKMSLLNEELARAIHERDQAINEGMVLREQLRKSGEESAPRETSPVAADLTRATKERDEAVAELQTLKAQTLKKLDAAKELRSQSATQEMSLLTDERDQARKQYFAIRKEYEELKFKQNVMPDPPAPNKELEKELQELKLQLAEKESEISALKATENAARKTGPLGDGDTAKLNEEINTLREQLTRAKEEASIAQRGLALSQKALHETRDTLREATEGTSLSRHNFDNLKNECATLSQQNAVLQAKNDQLMKDLTAAKSKITGRL